jgi:hypothetical protein
MLPCGDVLNILVTWTLLNETACCSLIRKRSEYSCPQAMSVEKAGRSSDFWGRCSCVSVGPLWPAMDLRRIPRHRRGPGRVPIASSDRGTLVSNARRATCSRTGIATHPLIASSKLRYILHASFSVTLATLHGTMIALKQQDRTASPCLNLNGLYTLFTC